MGTAVTTALQTSDAAFATTQTRCEQADPFVFHGRRLRPGCRLEDTSRFSDDVWVLGPAMLKKHERRFILDFTLIPAVHRQVGKELCYAMLSGAVPAGEERPAVGSLRTAFTEYVRFLRWAADRVPRLDALTGVDLEDFQRYLRRTLPAAGARQGARAGVRKFWLWRNALPSGALRFDPKHLDSWGEPTAYASENATARIPEEVLGPLFVWAMRFIDEFSADILVADLAWRTPPPPASEPHDYGQLPVQLRAWLDGRIASQRPLPAWRGKTSTTAIADALGRSRISLGRYRQMIDEAAAVVGTSPQTVSDQPIRGHLDGEPWIEAILADHTERDGLAALARLLQDACYLMLAFLSGARDSEIKHLKRGGLTIERDADDTPYRWKMHSLAFKAENDPAGVPAVWSIGEPAARAIAVLERLQPPGKDYLFARHPHHRRPHLASEEQPVQTHARLVHRPPPRRRHRRRSCLSAPLRPSLRRLRGHQRLRLPRRGRKRAGPRPRRTPHGRRRRSRAHQPHRPRCRGVRPPVGDVRRPRALPGQGRPR